MSESLVTVGLRGGTVVNLWLDTAAQARLDLAIRESHGNCGGREAPSPANHWSESFIDFDARDVLFVRRHSTRS